ncbi:MAG: antitoxin MazE family protein [Bifidobacteriaceae bacterium]|jgi:hypothetical protein|nr:antitoxin MazE family protein [Bifidobacteriaceae bacterium]
MAMTAAQRQSARRERLRSQKARPVQLWVADTRDPEMAERLRRQCRMLAEDSHEDQIMDWVEAASDTDQAWR